MTRRSSRTAELATDREVGVVAAVLVAGSEKAAAHRLGLSHSTVKHHLANARTRVGVATTAQLVWVLAPRLPEPEASPRRTDGGVCPTTLDPRRARGGGLPGWARRNNNDLDAPLTRISGAKYLQCDATAIGAAGELRR